MIHCLRRPVFQLSLALLLAAGLSATQPAVILADVQMETGSQGPDPLEKELIEQPTLSTLVAYAYQHSPLITAAKADWRAAIEKYRIDTALDDPELMFEGMYMPAMYTDPFNPDDWEVTLTQPLPLPGRLAKAGSVAVTDAHIARLQLDRTIRDTTTRIRESYQELLYLQEAKQLAAASREQLEQLRKVGETSSSDRATLVDIMKAQAQSGQLQYDALLLEESEQTERTRLNALLNREVETPIGPLAAEPVRPMVYSLQEIYPMAETNLEEIRIAEANVNRAATMVNLTGYENLPQFKLGISYGEVNQAQQVKVQAGFSLPLWAAKRDGRAGIANADLEKMRAMHIAQKNDTNTAIRDNYFRLQNSDRLIRLYRDDLIPQANRAMQTAELWFKQGQGSFSDYTETTNAWYNFHLALARAQADYGKSLARLEGLAGQELTRRDGAARDHAGQKESP